MIALHGAVRICGQIPNLFGREIGIDISSDVKGRPCGCLQSARSENAPTSKGLLHVTARVERGPTRSAPRRSKAQSHVGCAEAISLTPVPTSFLVPTSTAARSS